MLKPIQLLRIVVRGALNSKLLLAITGKRYMLCMGDSHTLVFRYINKYKLMPGVRFEVLHVSGATSQGMVNPNSKTNALPIFEDRLTRAKPLQDLLFHLGEVDCGFVIWYRAEKHGISVQAQLEHSINNYVDFLVNVRAKGFQNIYVVSVPLPTIADGQIWGEVTNLRKEVQASQQERTQLTLKYNDLLRERCREQGFCFLDVTSDQLDPMTGVVYANLLSRNPLDNHLEPIRYAELIARRLEPVLG